MINEAKILIDQPCFLNIFAKVITPDMIDTWPGLGGLYFFAVLQPGSTLLVWYKEEWRTYFPVGYVEE